MRFDSFSEFLAMGGHGTYVWIAYGVCCLVLVCNVALPVIKRKGIIHSQAQRIKREKAAS